MSLGGGIYVTIPNIFKVILRIFPFSLQHIGRWWMDMQIGGIFLVFSFLFAVLYLICTITLYREILIQSLPGEEHKNELRLRHPGGIPAQALDLCRMRLYLSVFCKRYGAIPTITPFAVMLFLVKPCSVLWLLLGLGPWPLQGSFLLDPVCRRICGIILNEGMV